MKPTIYGLGIDYLRFNLQKSKYNVTIKSYFSGLSENSREKDIIIDGYLFKVRYKNTTQKHILDLIYQNNIHAITIEWYKSNSFFGNLEFCVIFEGTFFYVKELNPLLSSFVDQYQSIMTVSRMDVALDVNIDVETLWKFRTTQFKKTKKITNNGKIETFYLGDRKHNKKYFIRVYNKLADIVAKNKTVFHHDYMKLERVTRIEVELHTLTIQALKITPSTILVYEVFKNESDIKHHNVLAQIIASTCINESGTVFYSLKGLEIANMTRLVTTKFTGRSEKIEKTRYVKLLLAYCRRMFYDGFDVHNYLDEKLKFCPHNKVVRTNSSLNSKE